MTYFPRLDRDWSNPHWRPKYFGGKRMPRRLKKTFKAYAFFWFLPGRFPDRWLPGTWREGPS